MKKIILALMMFVSMASVAFAAGKTTDSDAITFRNRIQNYIRDEGYSPSIDDDGDIKFKKEGQSYWITVESYRDGYYVKLYTGTVSSASMYKCLSSANKVMRDYKFVRISTTESDDSKVLWIENCWYCTTLSQFEQMFTPAMLVVSTCLSEVDDLLE